MISQRESSTAIHLARSIQKIRQCVDELIRLIENSDRVDIAAHLKGKLMVRNSLMMSGGVGMPCQALWPAPNLTNTKQPIARIKLTAFCEKQPEFAVWQENASAFRLPVEISAG